MALVAVCPEILQQGSALRPGEGRAVDAALKLPDGVGGDLGMTEQVDIVRPDFLCPGTARPVGIVVARRQEHRHRHPFQSPVYCFVSLAGIGSVKDIACQQNKIAALPDAHVCDFFRNFQKTCPQLPALQVCKRPQRGVNVPVCGMENSDHWISTLSALMHLPVAASMVKSTAFSLVGPSAG